MILAHQVCKDRRHLTFFNREPDLCLIVLLPRNEKCVQQLQGVNFDHEVSACLEDGRELRGIFDQRHLLAVILAIAGLAFGA